MTAPDVTVLGGGPIGAAIAWRCARRGLRVTVHDPGGPAAWQVSAGMLAPAGEATFGEPALTALQLASARRWPSFAAELAQTVGGPAEALLGYRTTGSLAVALTVDDLAEIRRLQEHQRDLGLPVEPLRPGELRDREPLLSPRVRGGGYLAGDHQVDPRRLVPALRRAAEAAGARFTPDAVGSTAGLALPGLRGSQAHSSPPAEVTVVAAGLGSAGLTGLPIRPVKGQILRLRARAGAAVLGLVIRGYADGTVVYLVPRADGELVVGATVEETADADVTAGGVLGLLRAAVDLVPEVAEYALVESAVGLRPVTPDNAPLIGWTAAHRAGGGPAGGRRVVVASGHGRNGILLAPITADAVTALVLGEPVPEVVTPFRPRGGEEMR
jgi:glycine oxidase